MKDDKPRFKDARLEAAYRRSLKRPPTKRNKLFIFFDRGREGYPLWYTAERNSIGHAAWAAGVDSRKKSKK